MFINMSPDDATLTVNIIKSAEHYGELCQDFAPGCFDPIVTPTVNTLIQKRFTFIGHAGTTFGKHSDTPKNFFDKLEKYNFPFSQCEEIDLIGCELGLVKDTENLSFAYQFAALVHAKYPNLKVRAPTNLVTNAPLRSMYVYVYSSGQIHISGMDQQQYDQYQNEVKPNLPSTSATPHTAISSDATQVRNYFITKHSDIIYDTHFSREALDRHPSFLITNQIKKLNANRLSALSEVNNRLDALKKINSSGTYNSVIATLEQLCADIKDDVLNLSSVITTALCNEELFEISQIKRLKKIRDGIRYTPSIQRTSEKFKQTKLLATAAELGLATECKQLMNDKAEVTLELAQKFEATNKKLAEEARTTFYNKFLPLYNRTQAHIAVYDKKYDNISNIKKYAEPTLTQADAFGWTPTMLALAQNDEKMLNSLEAVGVPIKTELCKRFPDKSTLAHPIVSAENLEAIKLLHNLVGIDIFNQIDKFGFTPTFNAIRIGKFAALQLLVKLKIQLNGPKGSEPARALVYYAQANLIAKTKTEECLNTLIAIGADFTAEDSKGTSIISEALNLQKWGIVSRMLMHISATHAFPTCDLLLIYRNKVEILAALKEYLSSPALTQKEKQFYFDLALNTANFLGGMLLESHKKRVEQTLFQPTEENFFKWAEAQQLTPPLQPQPLFVKRNQYALLP